MNCPIHPPASLAEFAAILQACGGPDWAHLAYLGLIVVILVALAVTLFLLALRQVSGR